MAKESSSKAMAKLIIDAVTEASARTGKPKEQVNYDDFSNDFKLAIKNQAISDNNQYRKMQKEAYAKADAFHVKFFTFVALAGGILSIAVAKGQSIYVFFGIIMIVIAIIGMFFIFAGSKR